MTTQLEAYSLGLYKYRGYLNVILKEKALYTQVNSDLLRFPEVTLPRRHTSCFFNNPLTKLSKFESNNILAEI